MYRHHPQWVKARQLVTEGGIGQLRTIQSFFSYYNADPANIRSQPETGGGGLMDIDRGTETTLVFLLVRDDGVTPAEGEFPYVRISAAGGRPTNSDLCYFNLDWHAAGVVLAVRMGGGRRAQAVSANPIPLE